MIKSEAKIINAFISLLSENSVFDITNDKIIQKASVAKGTFYSHFKNKNEIIKSFEKKINHRIISSYIDQYRQLDCPVMSPNLLMEIFAEVAIPIFSEYKSQISVLHNAKCVNEWWKYYVVNRYQRIVKKFFPKIDNFQVKLFVKYVNLLFQFWLCDSIPMIDNNFKREFLYLSHIKIRKLAVN